jgi:hypothetical protein
MALSNKPSSLLMRVVALFIWPNQKNSSLIADFCANAADEDKQSTTRVLNAILFEILFMARSSKIKSYKKTRHRLMAGLEPKTLKIEDQPGLI